MTIFLVQSMVDLLLVPEVERGVVGAWMLLLLLRLASFDIFLIAGLDR